MSQFGFKGGVFIARASTPNPWKYQMYPLLRPSSRLDSRLDVRRNQVANLVNVRDTSEKEKFVFSESGRGHF